MKAKSICMMVLAAMGTAATVAQQTTVRAPLQPALERKHAADFERLNG